MATAERPRARWWTRAWAVWVCRVVLGGTFVFSGTVKMIDLWGFIFKIEQYLGVWHLDEPRPLVLGVAMCLAGTEFLLGMMLIAGCYRRSAPILISMIMAAMLVLTGYIYAADPVDDCGCFGDLLVISNRATFLKNVVLCLLCVPLLVANRRVEGLFSPYSQWLVAFFAILYICIVGAFGYNVQPLLDFRPYPVGTDLAASEPEEEILFTYTDGVSERTFSADSLPGDEWTFVGRMEPAPTALELRTLTIYDGDDDVTDDVLTAPGSHLLALVAEPASTSLSSTYLLNELHRYMASHGGDMAAILGSDDSEAIDNWRDLSLADYPVYTSDESAVKEVARGDVALMWVTDGVIRWKRSLVSVDGDEVASSPEGLLTSLSYSGKAYFWGLTAIFIAIELLLCIADRSGVAVNRIFRRRRMRGLTARPNRQSKKKLK